jgi:hypothetical protein
MTPRTHLSIAALGVALGLGTTGSQTLATPADGAAVCPAPTEVSALHLYGTWQAQWDGGDTPATLTLGRNAEHPDGLRGSLRRGTVQALVAGDVDAGDFTLEESTDGRSISATWTGRVMTDSCGKEIRGRWANATGTTERGFVLRKLPGWQ